jgi:osmotically-inducible protein OsmY
MTRATDLLKIGTKVRFADRWQGRVSGFDVSPEWEVLNIVVTSGILFLRKSVKLPFSAVTNWGRESVDLDCGSFAAFAREVSPVAVPSQPLSSDTPVSTQGARFAGLIVHHTTRRATEVLISRSRRLYRIPAADARVDGTTLALERHFDTLSRFYPDADLEARIKDRIADDGGLTPDDKRNIVIDVEGGVATVRGNVRVEPAREQVAAIARQVPGVVSVQEQIVDDIALETTIGLALDRAGLARRAQVFARSSLGRVTLYGRAPNHQLADDVVREVVRIPGVRNVESRLALNGA